MAKIKVKKQNPKVSGILPDQTECSVPEFSIFFNFQYITKDSSYNLDYVDHKSHESKKIYKSLFSFLHRISQSSWEELRTKGKNSGGFETLEYSRFRPCIINGLINKNITSDTKLYVFRFGHDYRLVGYKSNRCRATIHIIGFDFDYSLYDHGS